MNTVSLYTLILTGKVASFPAPPTPWAVPCLDVEGVAVVVQIAMND